LGIPDTLKPQVLPGALLISFGLAEAGHSSFEKDEKANGRTSAAALVTSSTLYRGWAWVPPRSSRMMKKSDTVPDRAMTISPAG